MATRNPMANVLSRLFFVAVLHFAVSANADEPVRLDATSSASASESFGKMMDQLDGRQRKALAIAILRINLDGVGSVKEAMADPSLQAYGVERIKDKVAGMTASEIIRMSEHVTSVKVSEP